MSLVNTIPPLIEPVALSELKAMLRMDVSDTSQDDVIGTLAVAARGWCETVTQRRFVQQTWQLSQDYFPGYIDSKLTGSKISSPFVSGSNSLLVGIRYGFQLPYPPVQALNSFTYENANGSVTSMITGPLTISSVTNTNGQAVEIAFTTAHGLTSNSSITIAGNSALLALCGGVASQAITVVDTATVSLQFVTGTGSGISATGTATGYNFVLDLLSQPARLTPVFGSVWPVARITTNAVQISYTVGYATPIQITLTASSPTVGTYTSFTSANVGQPISIPGGGVSGGCLNTIIQSVSSGVATLRDLPSTSLATASNALLVTNGTPAHWELVRTAIKFLVSAWYVQRIPSFDKEQQNCIEAILGPCMDRRV